MVVSRPAWQAYDASDRGGRFANLRRTVVKSTIARLVVLLGFATSLAMPAGVLAQDSLLADWKFRAVLYGWFPTVSGASSHTSGAGVTADLNAEDYLDHLRFAFMGTVDARKDRWGVMSDYIYLDFDADKGATRSLSLSGPLGQIALPADAYAGVNLRLRGWAWSLLGSYALVDRPGYEMHLLGGTRYLKVNTTVDWRLTGNLGGLPTFATSGASTSKTDVWDAIVGAKGRYRFGDQGRWFLPYYLDVGTGQSDRTWQAMGGIGYSFSWGEVFAAYRHLDYRFDSGGMKDLSFSGPGVGLGFRW